MSWTEIVTPALTFLGGATGSEIVRRIANHSRHRSENARDDALAAQAVSNSVNLLLAPLNERIDSLAKDLEEQKAEREADRKEQERIGNLFTQAIAVIARFLDIARERGIPGPTLSPELLAEVHKAS